jgi:hypothetical protein
MLVSQRLFVQACFPTYDLHFFAFSVFTNGFQDNTVSLAEKTNSITAAHPFRTFT